MIQKFWARSKILYLYTSEEPCEGCAAPCGYKHHMGLTTNARTLADEVHKAKFFCNCDAPEGGSDAIMQATM